jgi:phenylacetate-coenzyme A ligase PaaK-like adenylate-forming protein
MGVISTSLALRMLLKDAGRSRESLKRLVNRRIRQMLIAAYEAPRHREAMRRAGYHPAHDFAGPEDLAILPPMTKAELKQSPLDFVQRGAADRLDRCFKDKTSGSTGTPLAVYRSARERDIQIAKWLRVLIQNGYRPTDKVLSFTSPERLGEGRSVLQRLGLPRRKAVDSTLPVGVLADELLRYRPDVVYAVRTSLLLVAENLENRGLPPPGIKLLVATGEVICNHARRQCRETLGVDVTETYGTVEMGVMAYQCPERIGLNLIEDCTWFEFLDEAGKPAKPGELARVVVTDLHGRLMPFIRYEQGDLATYRLAQNERGETVRVIDRIVGRQDDIVRLPDGSVLTYLDFYDLRYGYPGLQQLRVTQTGPLAFLVELVADPEYLREVRSDLLARLSRLSAQPLQFELRRVDQIAPDSSGKLRMLVAEHGNS